MDCYPTAGVISGATQRFFRPLTERQQWRVPPQRTASSVSVKCWHHLVFYALYRSWWPLWRFSFSSKWIHRPMSFVSIRCGSFHQKNQQSCTKWVWRCVHLASRWTFAAAWSAPPNWSSPPVCSLPPPTPCPIPAANASKNIWKIRLPHVFAPLPDSLSPYLSSSPISFSTQYFSFLQHRRSAPA